MTTVETSTIDLQPADEAFAIDDAQLGAVAFLARYNGRTLDAYRHDLRGFFQWAAENNLAVLAATRPHIELYRSWMEDRGLAASTIDRRLSTVCDFYRFAHIDGRIASNPAQYVRRPQVHPSTGRGLDRSELGVFLFTAEHYDRAHAALAVYLGLNGLRLSEACATNIEDLAIDLAVGERSEGPILRRHDGARLGLRTAHRWVRSIGKRAGLGAVHPHMLRAAFIVAALDTGVPSTRRPDRRPARGSAHDHDLRPATAELRPARRLRRRRVRRRRLTHSRRRSRQHRPQTPH